MLDGADDGFCSDLFLLYDTEHRHTDLFHVLCEMDCQLLPGVADVAAEFAGFVLGALGRLVSALLTRRHT